MLTPTISLPDSEYSLSEDLGGDGPVDGGTGDTGGDGTETNDGGTGDGGTGDTGGDDDETGNGEDFEFEIYNSQGSTTVVADPVGVGAFTVANLNDTDSDGHPDEDGILETTDADDTNGVPGEKDLMKLVLKKPASRAAGDSMHVTLDNRLRLYHDSEKANPVAADGILGGITFPVLGTNFDFDLSAGDKTLWVEAIEPSGVLRDMAITMTYTSSTGTKTKVANVTSLWATHSGTRTAAQVALLKGPIIGPAGTVTERTVSGLSIREVDFQQPLPFSPGDWIAFFKMTNRSGQVLYKNDPTELVRVKRILTGGGGRLFELETPLTNTYGRNDLIQLGPSSHVDAAKMLSKYQHYKFRLGDEHSQPRLAHGIEIRFTLQPSVPDWSTLGITIDVTRHVSTVSGKR